MKKTSKYLNLSGFYESPLDELGLDEDDLINVLPLKFFSLRTDRMTVRLRLPANFTYQLLLPKIEQSIGYYLKNVNNWMLKSQSAGSFGKTI